MGQIQQFLMLAQANAARIDDSVAVSSAFEIGTVSSNHFPSRVPTSFSQVVPATW